MPSTQQEAREPGFVRDEEPPGHSDAVAADGIGRPRRRRHPHALVDRGGRRRTSGPRGRRRPPTTRRYPGRGSTRSVRDDLDPLGREAREQGVLDAMGVRAPPPDAEEQHVRRARAPAGARPGAGRARGTRARARRSQARPDRGRRRVGAARPPPSDAARGRSLRRARARRRRTRPGPERVADRRPREQRQPQPAGERRHEPGVHTVTSSRIDSRVDSPIPVTSTS